MSLLLMGIAFIFFQAVFKDKFSLKTLCFHFFSNLGIFVICVIFLNDNYSYIFMTICSCIIFIFLEKLSLLKTCSYFCINLVILLNILFCTSFLTTPYAQILSILLYLSIGFILYFLLHKHEFDNLLILSIHEFSNFIVTGSLINLLLMFCIFGFTEISYNSISYIIGLDLFFIFSVTTLLQQCKNLYIKRKIDNLKLCNKTILNIHDETRTFKHDFHNIIQAIGGYISNRDLDGLQKYYDDVLNDCKILNNHSKLNPNLINNPAIYNILANKYYIAYEHNISIDLEVLLDLNELNMKIYEFTRILGILLDNAIESSKECTKKNINISFKKDNYKQILLIENTYNNKQISIDQIFEKNYSTKPNNTGLGLWEVRKILNKYSNLNLHTTKNNDFFSQQLEIYTN